MCYVDTAHTKDYTRSPQPCDSRSRSRTMGTGLYYYTTILLLFDTMTLRHVYTIMYFASLEVEVGVAAVGVAPFTQWEIGEHIEPYHVPGV